MYDTHGNLIWLERDAVFYNGICDLNMSDVESLSSGLYLITVGPEKAFVVIVK